MKPHRQPKLRSLDTYKNMTSGETEDDVMQRYTMRSEEEMMADTSDSIVADNSRDIGSPGAGNITDRIPDSDSEGTET